MKKISIVKIQKIQKLQTTSAAAYPTFICGIAW